MKKRLSRIRLINWHYFRDETICLAGSTLISGENTAGKSTILDAIQLVLTTNTRKFNTAANEKSNRDLKGYVRCKIGNEGQAYLRKNSVISYVALEFFEEKTGKNFVLGVQLLSPDEESKVITKWFIEEGTLEEFSFITDKRPSLPEEFRKNGKKVSLIDQVSTAKARFKRRMGNLEERFFDIIPKSLAFKPMDNVKAFINKFILPEENIDIENLRASINTLSELEQLMEHAKKQLTLLEQILGTYQLVQDKEREIHINKIMIKMAELDSCMRLIEEKKNEINSLNQKKQAKEVERDSISEKQDVESNRLIDLKVAMEKNEVSQLIAATKRNIHDYEKELKIVDEAYQKLDNAVIQMKKTAKVFYEQGEQLLTKDQLESFLIEEVSIEEKSESINTLEARLKKLGDKYQYEAYETENKAKKLEADITDTHKRIKELNNKVLRFPNNTMRLREAIDKEFSRQGIKAKVWVLSELLEITDLSWQDAVEGYLNTQRFYLLVEPEHYNKALTVYKKMQHEVHSVGLINTRKLPLELEVNSDSLAYVVKSENRYAKAYINFILGKVVRCEDIFELEKHKVAITSECMLYHNYAVRKIDEQVYKSPFIGANAFQIQMQQAQSTLKILQEERHEVNKRIEVVKKLLEAYGKCRIETIRENLDSPQKKNALNEKIKDEKIKLQEAEKDPSLIEIMQQIESCEKVIAKIKAARNAVEEDITDIKIKLVNASDKQTELEGNKLKHTYELEALGDGHSEEKEAAVIKYELNLKTKQPSAIASNFSTRNNGLENDKDRLLHGTNGLCELQTKFNYEYETDFVIGEEGIQDYIDKHYTLESSQIVKFEDQLHQAKENCEEVFRISFLAKMKENIESARSEFRELNRALQNIYYGEDSYYFEITYDKKKERLYNMIINENNTEGYTLWSSTFQEEYKEEIADLFAKLIANDDKGEKVLAEYTDYRNYLDYDIEVRKQNGTKQKFSKIYGEKSGGETQTPYYVAIAASFYQLYKFGDTIRILLLDEAFDKMDENRIASMMDFFNQLDFQVIIATPPAKIEVIGEKVDTILMAIRQEDRSIIETYDL